MPTAHKQLPPGVPPYHTTCACLRHAVHTILAQTQAAILSCKGLVQEYTLGLPRCIVPKPTLLRPCIPDQASIAAVCRDQTHCG